MIPILIKPADHGRDGGQLFQRIKINAAENDADGLFKFRFVLKIVLPKGKNLPAIRPGHMQKAFQCGAFAGTVFADQPHHAAGRDGKTHILQGKGRIAFGKMCNGKKRIHQRVSPGPAFGVSDRFRATLKNSAAFRKVLPCISARPPVMGSSSPKTTSRSPG